MIKTERSEGRKERVLIAHNKNLAQLENEINYLPSKIQLNINRTENPYYLNDFLTYMKVIKIRSDRTIDAYYTDIRLFLKYLKRLRNNMPPDTKLESVPIKDIQRLKAYRHE